MAKFKLIQAFMVVLVTCKNVEDSSKNEGIRVVTTFLPLCTSHLRPPPHQYHISVRHCSRFIAGVHGTRI